MNKRSILVAVMAVVMVCAGFSAMFGGDQPAKNEKSKSPLLWVCGCGPDCTCTTVSAQAGKCSCGKDLVPLRVLKIDQGTAKLCVCGEDCTCQISATDPAKCGCGKPLRTVSLKGLYVCDCGKTCTCNTISNEPGKCGCGHDLKKVE